MGSRARAQNKSKSKSKRWSDKKEQRASKFHLKSSSFRAFCEHALQREISEISLLFALLLAKVAIEMSKSNY